MYPVNVDAGKKTPCVVSYCTGKLLDSIEADSSGQKHDFVLHRIY